MTIYAVMKTGGKEYRVAPGDVVRVEKLEAAPGATVEIREVRLIEDGRDVTVGSPTVAGASVVAEVIEEGRGEKIVSFKKKRRNHYLMTIDDVRSYTILRIREIAVVKNAHAAVAPRSDMPAAAAPPPSPARLAKRERKVPEPHAKMPPQPPTPPTPAPIEVPPPVAAQEDAPIVPPPQALLPSSGAVHPVHPVEVQALAPRVEIAAPAPSLDERVPRKRSYGVPTLVVALLVIAAGLLLWGGRQTRVSAEAAVEVAPVAAKPQSVQPSVPQSPAKAPPRMETAIRKPAAANAPSAPVQPPE